MDSAELLDLLGNANRRRILRLLAQKPCYVTEISEFLGVSPKAVIDHLRKLEEAGLVESRTDDRRRKYFSIAENLRLEVNVSPYEFGTKSAYPASSAVDMTSCRYLSIEVSGAVPENDDDRATELPELAETLQELEQLENELSLAQRFVQGRLAAVRERIADAIADTNPRLVTELLAALAEDDHDTAALSKRVEAPTEVIEDVLAELEAEGVVTRESGGWHLGDS
ncbi:metalloregulator ArsR/SmtB family transcription factor [Salinibaculum rarum]|jgi:ArsR family transcriptional regulator|uniref:metalloregulator ArsR/SmtB family transcription factor n=1 Tax=Salinibaculum rarum TaxID=3058903 RepID=UPI00265EDBB2|nr:metalloregulator ArsR/SmtB family transcription factor [Salinibaculum sp. KK48]